MVNDEMMDAIDKLIEICSNKEQTKGMKSVREMLADFDEENWNDLGDSGAREEWSEQFLLCESNRFKYYELCYFYGRKNTGSIYIKTKLDIDVYGNDDEFLAALIEDGKIATSDYDSITNIYKITEQEYNDRADSGFTGLFNGKTTRTKISFI